MNVGKLIAEIAVLAIVVYCCYGAIVQAIPTDVDSFEDAFQVEEMNVGTSMNGLELTVTLDGSVRSKLPQDVDDVTVGIAIGEKDVRTDLTSVSVGTMKSNATTIISAVSDIPVYAILAYSIETDDNGDLTVPLVLSFAFKYMKWEGSYLIDMGLGVRQDLEMAAGTAPTVTSGDGPNSAKLQMTLDGSDTDGMINSVARSLAGSGTSTYNMTCGDAEMDFGVTKISDSYTLTMNFSGDETQNASQIMQTYLNTNGKLDLKYGEDTYSLEKNDAETFIKLVDEIYKEVPA